MRELNPDGSDPVEIWKEQELNKKLTEIAADSAGIDISGEPYNTHVLFNQSIRDALKAAYEAGKSDMWST